MPKAESRAKRVASNLVAEAAERQLLAGVLDILDRDTPAARDIVSGLTVEMFHGDGTGDVFTATREVLHNVAEPTVCDVLAALRKAGIVPGTEAHALFTDLVADRIGTGPQAARLAREAAVEVRHVHERRQAMEAATLVLNGNGHPDDLAVMVRHLERVSAASDAAGGVRAMTLVDVIDEWAKFEKVPTVPTGLTWFDTPTEGGLPIGGIVALVAYPGAGKTAMALQLTLAALVTDPALRCVWGQGEMSAHGMGRRMACVAAAILPGCEPVTMYDAGRRAKNARAANVALCNAIGDRLVVVPAPLTVEAIESAVVASGAKLLVVDYLQLLRGPERTTDRVQELEAIVGRIRDMAIKRDCAVIVISSMAKSAGTSSRIGQLGKGAGEIDYSVELLYLGDVEEHDGHPVIGPDGTVNVAWRCKKARNLEPRDLLLRFDGTTQTFHPVAVSLPQPVNGFIEFDGFAPRG